MKRRLFALLLILALLFSVAACNKPTNNPPASGNSPEQGGAPASGSSPDQGGGAAQGSGAAQGGGSAQGSGTGQGSSPASGSPVEITVAFNVIPNGLDPLTEDNTPGLSIALDVYDHLMWTGEDMNYYPGIAKSWKQVDSVTYDFEIDLNHVFQNGDPLTMDDIVFSILRMKDIPKVAEIGNFVSSATYEGNILTIKITEPNVTTFSKIVDKVLIVNKAYIEAGGDDAVFLNPISTGPYKVTEFVPGTRVVLETWDGYPFEKPQIDKITYISIPEDSARYIAAETGSVQYAALVTALEVGLAEGNRDVAVRTVQSVRVRGFSFNCEDPVFSNVNIRRALSYAMDRESMCALLGGRPLVKSYMLAGYPEWYVEDAGYPEFDLNKAKEMLEAEGYNESNPLKFSLMYFFPDPAVELYQSSLASIGVEMTLDLVEFSVYLSREGPGDYQMAWTAQTNRNGHPFTDLDRFDYSLVGSRDISRYNNARVQEIIDLMRTSSDNAELKTLAGEISRILADEVPMVGIYLDPLYSILANGLSGVTIRPDTQQAFRYATYTD